MDDQPPTTPEAPEAAPPEMQPGQPLPPHPAFATVALARRSRAPFWVLLLVVLLVSGMYGMYYWQHQKVITLQTQNLSADHAVNRLNNQVVELEKAGSSSTTLDISELGISVALPSKLSDMTYAVTTKGTVDDQTSTTVGLSTVSLIALDPQCNATTAPLGWLSRTNGQYPADPTTKNTSGKLVKQYSDYYIAYLAPQASCSSVAAAQTEVLADIAALPTWSTATQALQ